MRGQSVRRLRSAAATWSALTAALGVVAALGVFVFEGPAQRVVIEYLILVGLVVAIQTFVGASGILSFGHLAFVGASAYAVALVTIPTEQKARLLPELPEWLAGLEIGLLGAVAVGVLAASILAAVTGAVLPKMEQFPMAMATLAVLVMMHTIFANWETVTRGTIGILGIPQLVDIPVAFGAAVVVVAVSVAFQASAAGLRLQAVREDEVAASALGISVVSARRTGWLVSGALTGAAGAIWALNNVAYGPDQFFFADTFTLLSMLVIGGMRSVPGAVVGAAVVTVVSQLLRTVENGFSIGPIQVAEFPGVVQLAIALVILVVLVVRPDGIVRGEWISLARRLRGRAGR